MEVLSTEWSGQLLIHDLCYFVLFFFKSDLIPWIFDIYNIETSNKVASIPLEQFLIGHGQSTS